MVSIHFLCPLLVWLDMFFGAQPVLLAHLPFTVFAALGYCLINLIYISAMRAALGAPRSARSDINTLPGGDSSLGTVVVIILVTTLITGHGLAYALTMVRPRITHPHISLMFALALSHMQRRDLECQPKCALIHL